MKTSGELKHEFYEWLDKNPDKRASDWLHLKLAEHNKEIIEMIDEMIANIDVHSVLMENNERKQSYEIALTELKEKILETKK